jgi:hypothetical protein
MKSPWPWNQGADERGAASAQPAERTAQHRASGGPEQHGTHRAQLTGRHRQEGRGQRQAAAERRRQLDKHEASWRVAGPADGDAHGGR